MLEIRRTLRMNRCLCCLLVAAFVAGAALLAQARTPRTGYVVADVDVKTGVIVSCRILKSSGDPIADRAAVRQFREWRFVPNKVSKVRTPFIATREGIVFGGGVP
jgi:TonB family protein